MAGPGARILLKNREVYWNFSSSVVRGRFFLLSPPKMNKSDFSRGIQNIFGYSVRMELYAESRGRHFAFEKIVLEIRSMKEGAPPRRDFYSSEIYFGLLGGIRQRLGTCRSLHNGDFIMFVPPPPPPPSSNRVGLATPLAWRIGRKGPSTIAAAGADGTIGDARDSTAPRKLCVHGSGGGDEGGGGNGRPS